MPHVSRKKLEPETLRTLNDAVASVLSKNSLAETKVLLSILLTKTERIMIAKRLGMFFMLKQEAPEQEIADTLHVTPLTVMRSKMKLIEGEPEHFQLLFKRLARWENFEMFKDALSRLSKVALKKFVRGAGGRP